MENKEIALRSMPGHRSDSRTDALSVYRKQRKGANNDPRLQLTGRCEMCDIEFKNRQLLSNKKKPDEIVIDYPDYVDEHDLPAVDRV